jgi:hypothetical protein
VEEKKKRNESRDLTLLPLLRGDVGEVVEMANRAAIGVDGASAAILVIGMVHDAERMDLGFDLGRVGLLGAADFFRVSHCGKRE